MHGHSNSFGWDKWKIFEKLKGKEKVKGKFMCQPEQRQRYVSMANRKMLAKVHKRARIFWKRAFQRACSKNISQGHYLCSLHSSISPHTLKSLRGPWLKLQKQGAHINFGCDRKTYCKPLFIQLNWLPLHGRIEYNILYASFSTNSTIISHHLTCLKCLSKQLKFTNTEPELPGVDWPVGLSGDHPVDLPKLDTKLLNFAIKW